MKKTIEEKAKAYDEAIERAKYYYDEVKTLEYADDIASDIFPELAESEDEKIRKEIINYLEPQGDCCGNKERWIAWLEKQGANHIEKNLEMAKTTWSEEDKIMLDEIIDFFENGTVKLQHDLSLYASRLKSFKQRYTWKPSEEQMRALHDMNLTGNISYAGRGQTLIELYNDLKKL